MGNWGTEQSTKPLKIRQSQGQKADDLSIYLAPCILGHATSPMYTCLIPNQGWATVCLTSNTKQFLILENYAALSSYNTLDKKLLISCNCLARSPLPEIWRPEAVTNFIVNISLNTHSLAKNQNIAPKIALSITTRGFF